MNSKPNIGDLLLYEHNGIFDYGIIIEIVEYDSLFKNMCRYKCYWPWHDTIDISSEEEGALIALREAFLEKHNYGDEYD